MRQFHALLYGPVVLIAGVETVKAVWVLAHGLPAGLYALPYGLATWLLCRRAMRAWRGELSRPGMDAALVGAAFALWAFLMWTRVAELRSLSSAQTTSALRGDRR